jgi:hypothetical protein
MNCAECKELLVEYIEGLLAESDKKAVASHLKDCPACQTEHAELTALRGRLVNNGRTVAQSDLENDVMNQIVRERRIGLKAAAKAGLGLRLRRIIMKSPITRMAAAAAIIIVALVGVNSLLGPTVTFADVVEPILNARTIIFDIIVGDEETSPLMHEIVVGSRIRRTISNIENTVQIIDLEGGKMLVLNTEEKQAIYTDIEGFVQEGTRDYVDFLRKVIINLQDDPDIEELGEQQLDGQRAIAFAARGPNEEVKIWADPETAVPIRVELQAGLLFAVMKNFEFDVPIDESLISMDVPAGYTLQETEFDLSGATEQDFIESLRIWAEVLLDGRFPETIGTESTMKQMPLLVEKLPSLDLPDEEMMELPMKFARGMLFLQVYETSGQWHYAGTDVELGDADTPIFWYLPKDSETYRVIYGDLSVEDVAPENLPE